jgi:hypothetical protein
VECIDWDGFSGFSTCNLFCNLSFCHIFWHIQNSIVKLDNMSLRHKWTWNLCFNSIQLLLSTGTDNIFNIYTDYLLFYVPLKNISLIWRRHHCRGFGQCSAPRTFEQGGTFILPHLKWHGASVFPVSSEGPPHSVASYDTQGDVEDLL